MLGILDISLHLLVGEHQVNIKYCGTAISGSPFNPKAWDSSQVVVTNINQGRMGKPSYFNSKLRLHDFTG